jgi:hypothetical protein
MKSLLAETHPLHGQEEVDRHEEADQRAKAGEHPQSQTEAYSHFPEGLQEREQGDVWDGGLVQELLVPQNRIL